MKRKSLFALLLLTIAFAACFKTTNDNRVVTEPPAGYLYFNVNDKTSGKDLFFSSNPAYNVKDIIVLAKNINNAEKRIDTLGLFVDSSRNCLVISFGWTFYPNIYIHFPDNITDTLLVKSFVDNYADSVYFNNKLYRADSKGNLTFEKS
ncbi:MAG TPA: hypothetical protein VFQ86_02230 [Arachidicoccus soli]|nr:hypothetical protein [Arachidicoccus soli]